MYLNINVCKTILVYINSVVSVFFCILYYKSLKVFFNYLAVLLFRVNFFSSNLKTKKRMKEILEKKLQSNNNLFFSKIWSLTKKTVLNKKKQVTKVTITV